MAISAGEAPKSIADELLNNYGRKQSRVVLCGLLIGAAIMFTHLASHAALYKLTGLGGISHATDINNAGQIVGTTDVGGFQQPLLYSNGAITQLPWVNRIAGAAPHLNDSGMVVGTARITDSVNHVVLYRQGSMTDLGIQGTANGINNSGQVVGTGPGSRAFLYSNGSVVNLAPFGPGPFGEQWSRGNGINDAGDVVGASSVPDAGETAFLYRNGVMMNLGQPGLDSNASAVNNAGQIVGRSIIDWNFGANAVLWSDGAMSVLGRLAPMSAGAQALAVNDAGQIVGASQIMPGDFTRHAFFSNGGPVKDLNDRAAPSISGWTLLSADAINNRGQIVGSGTNPLGMTEAYLLTPVPIPGAFCLFGSGLFAFIGWRKLQHK